MTYDCLLIPFLPIIFHFANAYQILSGSQYFTFRGHTSSFTSMITYAHLVWQKQLTFLTYTSNLKLQTLVTSNNGHAYEELMTVTKMLYLVAISVLLHL